MSNTRSWLLVAGASMLAISFVMPGGASVAGWTLRALLTLRVGVAMDAGNLAMRTMGASSIVGSISITGTVLKARASDQARVKALALTRARPITAYLLTAAMPVSSGRRQ